MKYFATVNNAAVWLLLVQWASVEPEHRALWSERNVLYRPRPVGVTHDKAMAGAGDVRIAGPDMVGLYRADRWPLCNCQHELLPWVERKPYLLRIRYANAFVPVTR